LLAGAQWSDSDILRPPAAYSRANHWQLFDSRGVFEFDI
jgi:hypothetical protein